MKVWPARPAVPCRERPMHALLHPAHDRSLDACLVKKGRRRLRLPSRPGKLHGPVPATREAPLFASARCPRTLLARNSTGAMGNARPSTAFKWASRRCSPARQCKTPRAPRPFRLCLAVPPNGNLASNTPSGYLAATQRRCGAAAAVSSPRQTNYSTSSTTPPFVPADMGTSSDPRPPIAVLIKIKRGTRAVQRRSPAGPAHQRADDPLAGAVTVSSVTCLSSSLFCFFSRSISA